MPVTKGGKNKAEEAVRAFLLYLADPASLRDDKSVQKATQAVLDATDPLAKLKALAELEKAANPDPEPLFKGFVEHAFTWASDNGIPVSAFRELKVADADLRQAGFDVPQSSGRSARRGGTTNGRQRAKAVPSEDIKAFIVSQKGTFLLVDVINGVGGSQATVRKALDELISAGHVEKLGTVPDYQGRGRAPIQYKRATVAKVA